MNRLFPAPLLSLLLFVVWLALDTPPSASQAALAALAAVAIPALAAPLRPHRIRLRRPGLALMLCARVIVDALASNASVVRALVRGRDRAPDGAFVRVPLSLTDPAALAVLAVITTVVPGTIWCELAHDRSEVRLHVLDPGDEQAFVDHFKARYERPLLEIFR